MTRGIGGGKHMASFVDTFAPPTQLLVKVGTILVHLDEALGQGLTPKPFTWSDVRSMLADREVQEWLTSLRAKSLLPVKRLDPQTGRPPIRVETKQLDPTYGSQRKRGRK